MKNENEVSELIRKFKQIKNIICNGGQFDSIAAFDEFVKILYAKSYDVTSVVEFPFRTKDEVVASFRALTTEKLEVTDSQLFDIVKILITIDSHDNDMTGIAFQTFVNDTFRRGSGQFFTPEPVTAFITDCVCLSEKDKVLDPACGSGGFLIQALKCTKNVHGMEINGRLARIASMNVQLHGGNGNNITETDALNNRKHCDYDVILTNPPFGTNVSDNGVFDMFEKNKGFEFETYGRRVSLKTESLFLEQCYNLLREGGLLAAVVPDGVLLNKTMQSVRD